MCKIPLHSLDSFGIMPVVYVSAVIKSLCHFMDQVILRVLFLVGMQNNVWFVTGK